MTVLMSKGTNLLSTGTRRAIAISWAVSSTADGMQGLAYSYVYISPPPDISIKYFGWYEALSGQLGSGGLAGAVLLVCAKADVPTTPSSVAANTLFRPILIATPSFGSPTQIKFFRLDVNADGRSADCGNPTCAR